MTARTLLALLLALILGLPLAACGGDGGEERLPGRLTDPRDVPTATPRTQPLEPIILEPGVLTPTGDDGGGEDGTPTPDTEVTPVTPFQITSDESTNVRSGPSTESAVLRSFTADEEETVTGQAIGEEVDEGNNVWYQLEDGGFVYSGAVKEVEE